MVEVAGIARESVFSYRYRLEDHPLKESVCRCGILLPVMLIRKDRLAEVVAGHKRLAAARALGIKRIPAFFIEGKTSARDLFLISLISNWKQDVPDMDRVTASVKALREFRLSEDEVREIVLPLLGLSPERPVLTLYLKAHALSASLKDCIWEKKIPFRASAFLLNYSRSGQECFARIAGRVVKFSTSQCFQSAEWLWDICKREGQSLRIILGRGDFRKILRHKQMDPRTKADRFFDAVRKYRFPEFSSFLGKFEDLRSRISGAGPMMRVEPIPGFEEPGLDVSARLRSREELEGFIAKLAESRPALNSLFDFML